MTIIETVSVIVAVVVGIIGGVVTVVWNLRAMRQQGLPEILRTYRTDELPDDVKKFGWLVKVDDAPFPWGLNLYNSERGLCLKHKPPVKWCALAPPGIAVVPWSEVAPRAGRSSNPFLKSLVVRHDSGSSIISYLPGIRDRWPAKEVTGQEGRGSALQRISAGLAWGVAIATAVWLIWIGPMLMDMPVVLLVGTVVMSAQGIAMLLVALVTPTERRRGWTCEVLGWTLVGQAVIVGNVGFVADVHRVRFFPLIAVLVAAGLILAVFPPRPRTSGAGE